MSCVCCFFDNQNQKKIKQNCFGVSSFKQKLQLYKKQYITEFKKMESISKCSCDFASKNINNQTYVDFCNDMMVDYKEKVKLIENIFDELISIFVLCENNHKLDAFSRLENFLKNYCTNYSTINNIQMCDILFRGREVGTYDSANIHEFYHIPFNRKDKAGSQRFSIKGKPMLYLAKSIPIATQELKLDFEKINFALYFPKYSWVYRREMYDFSNSIDVTINQALSELIRNESKIKYDNSIFTFSKRMTNRILGDSILFQILTFPVESKDGICKEYLLPQLCTEYFESRGYLGVVYQSTKSADMFQEHAKYSQRDFNYCFFVPEEKENKYNENLLSCFHTACIGECDRGKVLSDVIKILYDFGRKLKEQNEIYNMSDYIILKHRIESHIEYMRKTVVGKKCYYESTQGYVELDLIYHLVEKVIKIVNNPIDNGIIKWSEIN